MVKFLFNLVEFLNIWAYLKGSIKRPKAIPQVKLSTS
jgi:hypothetical protein